MPFDIEKCKTDYDNWVETYRKDFEAGKTKEAVKHYPFVVSEDVPWTPFTGDPSEKTFALITSGGLYLKETQPAFEPETIEGDSSFREIPKTVRFEEIGIAHGHYDPGLAEQDLNTIFPIRHFIDLEKDGTIGRLAGTHYSFSYVNDVVALLTESAPKVLHRVREEGVDALFLVPV
jgi:glycine/betaine/sarcosine/D-proline reductase family selenoprotein B